MASVTSTPQLVALLCGAGLVVHGRVVHIAQTVPQDLRVAGSGTLDCTPTSLVAFKDVSLNLSATKWNNLKR